MTLALDLPKDRIADLCRQHKIKKLGFFGSVVRKDFSAESDIDILVEFEQGAHATYFDLIHAEEDLQQAIGPDHKADVLTPRGLHPLLREEILGSLEVIYES